MTNDLIEKFIEKRGKQTTKVNIHFKQRNTVQGMFIQTKDYEELKSKNFWRIVTESNSEEWKRTGDQNLARIFNGAEFSRLTDAE
ncbi:MAG TPA: short-chain dehydrogenase [Lacibacter sp.]|nr:short-chain dehydrogenase [Lacibacter sp.]